MKKPFLIAMALIVAPFGAQAETWNIYGWQNHSWEFVDIDGGRSFDRIQSNAGNIGFAASVPTGFNDLSVNVQCEQFMYVNHFAGGTGWCNRNSKIGLSHPQMGELMLATWLLPYNEGVAQWVDPFYDAGADSHTSIMGSVGANTIFYNTGDFDFQASGSSPGSAQTEFNYQVGGYDTGFNRRQENIIQYWSPNWNGFVFRFAWTAGNRDETPHMGGEIDPVIRSSSLAYTNGPVWAAVTWQDHEDWTAASVGQMETSDAESLRVAGRYIMDMGGGMSVQISAMWETLEYEFNGVTNVDAAMTAFGYSNFGSSYSLLDSAGEVIGMTPAVPASGGEQVPVDDDDVKAQKTIDLLRTVFPNCWDDDNSAVTGDNANGCPTGLTSLPNYVPPTSDNPATEADEGVDAEGNPVAGNGGTSVLTEGATGTALMASITALNNARDTVDDDNNDATTEDAGVQPPDLTAAVGDGTAGGSQDERDAHVAYLALVAAATDAAEAKAGKTPVVAAKPAVSAAANRAAMTMGQNVKIERDAWMVSGKIKMGGPIDFRFSYMDADDLEVSCASCSGDWDETAADAFNVGIFYTMPAGTELRLTYSEVNNDDNGTYGQGISGTGLGSPGVEIEMFAVGIVHWFD